MRAVHSRSERLYIRALPLPTFQHKNIPHHHGEAHRLTPRPKHPDSRSSESTAMAIGEEELHEAEVLWPEQAPQDDDAAAPGSAPPGCSSSPVFAPRSRAPGRRGAAVSDPKPRDTGSRPVDIPRPARPARWRDDDDDEDDGGRRGTMVPPHVLVSRRRSSEGAVVGLAMRSGPGRARELSHLRNSVLRMTGFIEG
ncbi:hypothetical protein ACP4OV_025120 [Aristida adscensionis]